MQIGDLVEYKEASGRLGIVIKTQGKQWVKDMLRLKKAGLLK